MEKKELFAQAISDILVRYKVLELSEARALQRNFKNSGKEQFDNFLLEEGLVDEADLLRALSEYYQVPSIDVTGYFFDTLLLRNFPKDFLLRNQIIPLEIDEDILSVVASNVNNSELLPALGKYTSKDIRFQVGLARDITDAVKEFYDKSPTDLLSEQEFVQERQEQIEEADEWLHYEEEDLK